MTGDPQEIRKIIEEDYELTENKPVLSLQTIKLCHQALAAAPARNAQQARIIANALFELEAAMKEPS